MSELVPQTDVDASNVIDAQQQPEKVSKNILVAVDGSRVSRKAMATAATLCPQQNNNLIVYHIWNPRKKGIPWYFSPEYLEIEFGRVNLKVIPVIIPERNNISAGLSTASIQIKMIVR